MLAASSGLTSSSASRDSIQSWVALASAEFFCGAKPFHGSTKTRAPKDCATTTVRSVLPESTTTISLAMDFTLSSVRARLASSFNVMIQTERLMHGRIPDQERLAKNKPGWSVQPGEVTCKDLTITAVVSGFLLASGPS